MENYLSETQELKGKYLVTPTQPKVTKEIKTTKVKLKLKNALTHDQLPPTILMHSTLNHPVPAQSKNMPKISSTPIFKIPHQKVPAASGSTTSTTSEHYLPTPEKVQHLERESVALACLRPARLKRPRTLLTTTHFGPETQSYLLKTNGISSPALSEVSDANETATLYSETADQAYNNKKHHHKDVAKYPYEAYVLPKNKPT